jgi:TRAP-type C4-dicarboxylate transport system substrate-binding protein
VITRRSAATAALVFLAGYAQAQAPANSPITLKFAQLVPFTHPYHTGIIMPWIADVEKATNGRVKVEVTTAPLGPMARNYDLVQQGVVDIAGGNHLLNPGRFDVTQIIQGHVGVDSPEAVSVAFYRTYKRFLEKANEHVGTHVLAVHVSGAAHIFTTKKEVKTTADISGLKLLVPGVVMGEMVSSLKGVPITRAVPEYYDAVSKGIVDGVLGTNSAVSGFKVEPLINYHLEIPGGLHFSSFFLTVNKAKWDSLSKADRDAIDGVSGERLARLAGRVLGKQIDDVIAARRAEGRIKTTVASPQVVADFQRQLEFFEKNWKTAASAKGVDGESALKYFKEQAAAYRPGAN